MRGSMRRMGAFLLLVAGLHTFATIAWAENSKDKKRSDTSPSVEELLSGSTQEYVDAPRCIRTHSIRSSEVIDDKHVVFRTGRDTYYLVQLEHRCPGLERDNPIFYETNTNRLCALDGIRGSYSSGFGSFQPGMRCGIPGFQSVTKEQIVMLKDALKAERRKRRTQPVESS